MIFPVVVPILATVAPEREIAVKLAAPEFSQVIFVIVFPWISLAVPVAVDMDIAVKALFWVEDFAMAGVPHCSHVPPI